jgi:hypothetical protein
MVETSKVLASWSNEEFAEQYAVQFNRATAVPSPSLEIGFKYLWSTFFVNCATVYCHSTV